jgi:DNA-binding PadR family transcriptional regulator
MDGPTDIRYEITERGQQLLRITRQIGDLEASLYLSNDDEMTKAQKRAQLHNLEEEAFRLLHES